VRILALLALVAFLISPRFRYFFGKLLGVDDFDQEFEYLRDRARHLAGDLTGYGAASGLETDSEAEKSDDTGERPAKD
jgi:hypothetical protein